MYWNVAGAKILKGPYISTRYSDVCCCPDYIFLAEKYDASVQVYSWTIHHIQTLSDQQLGIEKEDKIRAIQCNHDGTVLQLVIGDHIRVHSLHAYKVRSPFTLSYTTHGFIIRSLLSEDKEKCISATGCDL